MVSKARKRDGLDGRGTIEAITKRPRIEKIHERGNLRLEMAKVKAA
jgi:hypothetical protein